MKTSITKRTDNELTIEIKITLTGSMLEGISKNRAEHFVKISMLKFGAEIL